LAASLVCEDNVDVRLGIRAQLVVSIALLLILGLAPLSFALSSVARASLMQSWQKNANALGRAVAGHVGAARERRSDAELEALLRAQLGQGIGAIGVYDEAGALTVEAGIEGAERALPRPVVPTREQVVDVSTERGAAIVVLIPGRGGPVGVLLHVDPSAVPVTPLVRLVALYTGLLGLGLLVLAYIVLTRLVVRPIEQLSLAAGRVADGGRELVLPRTGGRELMELGQSLAQMTRRLRDEEEALRKKVSEVEEATAELRRAQDTLVRTERLASVGRLAAGLAHEIGNPITAMLGLLDLLREGGLDEEDTRDFLERLKHETERINRILRDLLTFARPAVKDGADVAADADCRTSLAEALEHVVALTRPQKSFDGVEVQADLDDDVPPVAMHASRIEQILLNLLMNAADAVDKPGGLIEVTATASGDDDVTIRIEDNGGGIPPSVRHQLFEPFVTTKEPGKGTGLGLAVCRGLIEAAGGQIDVEDGACGARFLLRLPRADGTT
jgi:signal transduction histidine kinase